MRKNNPSIILVRPQLPENIGMVARAMHNCNFNKLFLVSPREIWPNEKSLKSSANSKKIIQEVKVFKNLNDVLKSHHYVIATSSRKRFLSKPIYDDFNILYNQIPLNKKIAFIFGPENSGLSNDDLMLCDSIFNIQLLGKKKSLNLSHAALIILFKWNELILKRKTKNLTINNNIASKEDFLNFMNFLYEQLTDINFFYPKNKSKSMFNNIKTMFLRSNLSKTEILTLWGMIKKLRNSVKK